jgi:superkiller protein 3
VTSQSDQGSSHAKWAHLRLGMHYMAVDEPSKAIISLQYVLRIDPDDLTAWESLADAYLSRGSYTAALKAYDRTLAFANCRLYSQLQIATIKHKLGYFAEAKMTLRQVLQFDPQYVPALKVLAESLLQEAREFLEQSLDLNVVDNCQEAIKCLTEALQVTRWSFNANFYILYVPSILQQIQISVDQPYAGPSCQLLRYQRDT